MADPFASARAAWPGVELSPEVFATYLTARALTLEAAHLPDLYLACACLERLPAALRVFDEQQLV